MAENQAHTAGVIVYATEVESLRDSGEIQLLVHLENLAGKPVKALKAHLQFFDAFDYHNGSASGSLARLEPGERVTLRAFGKLARPVLFKTRLALETT